MRFLFRLLLLTVLLLVLAVPVGVVLMLQDKPLVAVGPALGPQEVARAQALAKRHDPRRLSDGQVSTVTLTDADLVLLLRYAASLLGQGAGAARVDRGRAELWLTARIPGPATPLGQYLNIQVALAEGKGRPQVVGLRLGHLNIPGGAADWVLWTALDSVSRSLSIPNPTAYVEAIAFAPGRASLRYRWDSSVIDAVRGAAFSDAEKASLKAHQEHFAALSRSRSGGGTVELSELITAMFAHGRQRAAVGAPADENRAALLVLSSHLGGPSLKRLVPEAAEWPRASGMKVKLQGRGDLAQHFSLSAAIAALGSTSLSNAIGLFKEVDDSRGG